MSPDHAHIVSQMSRPARAYLINYFALDCPLLEGVQERGLGQSDLVLALLRGPPALHPWVDRLVGRPVQRLPAREVRPLPVPVSETPPADRRRVLTVAPNPRLPTTHSFQRFREIRVGRTVAQLLQRGVTRRDLREAIAEGWVQLEAVR